MFLALRELRYARLRYLMIGAIITLIAWLVFLLSGLANGLANDSAAAIKTMPASAVVFQQGSQLLLQRSTLPEDAVSQVRQVPGVTAATPLGQSTVTVQREAGGDRLAATILAIDPRGFLVPPIVAGQALADAPDGGVVVDRSLTRDGVRLGDSLTLQPGGARLTVVGLTSGRTYSHMPVIYASVTFWQGLQTPGAAPQTGSISAVVIQGDASAEARITASVPGVQVGSRAAVVQALPGYAQESGSLTMIQAFLVVIAAFIIAAFFYVLTLQKTAQFGLLKALGAKTGVLGRDLLGQVLLLTIVGESAGALLAMGVSRVIPNSVPFLLATPFITLYGGVLLVVALLGALLSLRRIATIDALTAIGRAD
ncbi:MAG TPA: ABC transporter permease [Ktedonobacterales bacterium]|nr:ABC transporter permease [Ktedonobacterales bacterium]